MKTQKIEYHDDDVLLEGYYACDDTDHNKKPVILIAHDWSGRNEFVNNKAEKLAELGYIGFAIDMYGQGVRGETKEEKTALIQPFMQDRAKLQKRIVAAYEAAKKLEFADATKIAAIGFCFGGLCALDLARTGADLKAVVSFHGLLLAPENIKQPQIHGKVLILHGFDDPMVPAEQVIDFCKEFTEAKANWEVDMYGHTMHAFTNPQANDPGFGLVYNNQANSRSWTRMKDLFAEVF